MRIDTTPIIRLEDYRPSDFLIDNVELDVKLHPTETRVIATLAMRPNPEGRTDAPLVLDGDELNLRTVALNGRTLAAEEFEASPQSLTIAQAPRQPFTLTIETEINPTANTKLMGLYRSSGNYCTQCEAEGFRRITYFLDRPDVLSVYTTRIEAERDDAPVLLGNGNPVESGTVQGSDRHYAVWHDPHPKPSYLFALVGGRLGRLSKSFTTLSGRAVELAIYVEPGKEDRADYALDALERSMRWDERVFGREYDLDVFNIVAVSDFNMGAMENKGLNIFNDKYVLASPETATDMDYAHIEAIIAHEYFHNWTGNRVTCRDWFQLCLKEGLTVFRDQEFSSDERSRPVHRIAEVKTLRARQFLEDSGPLAHPVRPSQYREINNFYTATVYEKGAEIVRMLKTIIGDEDFRRGMDVYFERCDGTAATVEDFLNAFADVTRRDLSHFARWYEQSGTPRVKVKGQYDSGAQTYRLDFAQSTPPTPGQPKKDAMAIPVALGLVTHDGSPLNATCDRVDARGVFLFDKPEDGITFMGVTSLPVPSLFRGFSAPVKVSLGLPDEELLVLLRHDTDAFNRWQAAQTVAMRLLAARSTGAEVSHAQIDAFSAALASFMESDAQKDPAFAALVITLPSEADIAQEIGQNVNPDAIHRARTEMRRRIGLSCANHLRRFHESLADTGRYSPDATSAGRRSLRNASLDLLAAADPSEGESLAVRQLESASNMTDRLASLSVLTTLPGAVREEALARFGERYRNEPLVLDKWFTLQAAIPEDGTLERVKGLMQHPAFSIANPNRVRALIGSFAMLNQVQFNREDGAGYRFLASVVLRTDELNPQLAARLLTAFSTWRMMESTRRSHAEEALRSIAQKPNLSRDVGDIVSRSLEENQGR
ncbi:aminopeptidase N [Microvirga lotononidis]|uniref:Aminopeptidase N n=1 Tax=Microvirga lotononidis TaxID=864069 RepID=I4YNB3_9HYPH|nr:aminopeptidase N [Microvirga lotononidis]EIM25455.1 aminopeptidase N [Microvirga lotononidis]WQO26233.1 aminopeptidase N [Microvirga lotononidis]